MLGDSDCINDTSQEERDTNVNQTQHYSGQHSNTQWVLRNWLSRLGRECNARNATEIGTWHAHCKQHGRAQNVNVKQLTCLTIGNSCNYCSPLPSSYTGNGRYVPVTAESMQGGNNHGRRLLQQHTALSAAQKRRQPLDYNSATTYRLGAYILHCNIC